MRGSMTAGSKTAGVRDELRRCASLVPRIAREIGLTPDERATVCAAPLEGWLGLVLFNESLSVGSSRYSLQGASHAMRARLLRSPLPQAGALSEI
jgi:hypothetical protein